MPSTEDVFTAAGTLLARFVADLVGFGPSA
jgi:hypothetical protein